MATVESPRIRGKKLGLTIDKKEVWPDIIKAELAPVDSDGVQTFASIAAGGTKMQLNISGIQSTKKDSLWRALFDNVGKTLEFMLAPHGNTTPSADEPHFTGKITIETPPTLSSEVNTDSQFDLSIPVDEWKMTTGTASV